MPWLLVVIAGLFEIGWVVALKYSHGFTRLWPSSLTVLCLTASMLVLAQAARTLPLGTAYAVWTGIGAAGAAFAGMILFNEAASPARLVCIGLIIVGLIGLKLTAPA